MNAPGCWAQSSPVLQLDIPEFVAAWNTRGDTLQPTKKMRIEKMDTKTLIDIATGKIPHNRSGLCPDELQPDSRDPDCPACKILIEAAHDAIERRLLEAEARVAELVRWVCGVRPANKGHARVPRDTEPCNLVTFLGFVAGGTAAALVILAILALAGWMANVVVDAGVV